MNWNSHKNIDVIKKLFIFYFEFLSSSLLINILCKVKKPILNIAVLISILLSLINGSVYFAYYVNLLVQTITKITFK